jgi:hypothetical protein
MGWNRNNIGTVWISINGGGDNIGIFHISINVVVRFGLYLENNFMFFYIL